MNDSKKLSRRDWFRLRIPHQNKMLSEPTPEIDSETLIPIEHPPNHDGMDLSQLPPMSEATISLDQMESLFRDIEELATDVLLMQRSTPGQRATASKVDVSGQLSAAHKALVSGRVRKLQIRYRWQSSLWIDTIETLDIGFRLVRIAHQQV